MSDNDYQKYMQDSRQRTKKLGGYQQGVDVVQLPVEVLKNIGKLFSLLDGQGKENKPPKFPPQGG